MPPKRGNAPPAAASKKTSTTKKASSTKKVSAVTGGVSNKKKQTAATSSKKRKAQNEDESNEDQSDVAGSAAASSSSSKKPALKKRKGGAEGTVACGSDEITFPIRSDFDTNHALEQTTDLSTAISIALAACPGVMSFSVKKQLEHRSPHLDLKPFQATLNKMIKDGTVIKDEYIPGGGAKATRYFLTAQMKCLSCGTVDPSKGADACFKCGLSYCYSCREKFSNDGYSWTCNTCVSSGK